jgi:uncharacterized Zn-binding protein involved in type VI secretion
MGMPAARLGDMHVCPMVTVLVPHVGGPIGGLAAAQLGSMCAHGGAVVVGCPTVLIS